MALEAIRNDEKLSLRAVAKLYDVLESTLCGRRGSKLARRDCLANSRQLTDSKERAIVQYILELDTQGFLPRLRGIEDIAN